MWGGPWPRIPVSVPTNREPNKQGLEALTYPPPIRSYPVFALGPPSPKSQSSPMDQKAGGERTEGALGSEWAGERGGARTHRGCPGEGQTAPRPGTAWRAKGL